jgi:hypothetical protein
MVPHTVAEIIREHVTLEVEGIDRMYLNAYVSGLQTEGGFVHFVRNPLEFPIASTAVIAPLSDRSIHAIEQFAKTHHLDVVTFEKNQRKDDLAKTYLARCTFTEGVLFRGSALPNHYYFYLVDEDFGPLFIKFCSYFPYAAKVCLNGHEWVKRQLTQAGIAFEALDNGVLSCEHPARLQDLCDSLDSDKIDAVFRKWLARLPHPFPPQSQAAGYRYELSVLQAEFSLTQVLDFPRTGRPCFEEVIRENLDIGRPDQVPLLFNRRVTRRTPGTWRTRGLTEGVVPSLYAHYKRTQIKPYHRPGAAHRNHDQRHL